MQIEIKNIKIMDRNPRTGGVIQKEESFKQLIEDITANGVITPITVNVTSEESSDYQLIAGERRLLAATQAGLTTIPCNIMYGLSDEECFKMAIAENLHRKDLTAFEEAESFSNLLDVHETFEAVAAITNKTVGYVKKRLVLKDLITEYRKVYMAGGISIEGAIMLARLPKERQKAILEERNWKDFTAFKSCGTEDLADLIDEDINDLKTAFFNTKDISLVPKMGACTDCKYNTGNDLVLFEDMQTEKKGKVSKCLLTECFDRKTSLSYAAAVKKAIEDDTVLLGVERSDYPREISKEMATAIDAEIKKSGKQIYVNYQDFKEAGKEDKDSDTVRLFLFKTYSMNSVKTIRVVLLKAKKTVKEKIAKGVEVTTEDKKLVTSEIKAKLKRTDELLEEKIIDSLKEICKTKVQFNFEKPIDTNLHNNIIIQMILTNHHVGVAVERAFKDQYDRKITEGPYTQQEIMMVLQAAVLAYGQANATKLNELGNWYMDMFRFTADEEAIKRLDKEIAALKETYAKRKASLNEKLREIK